MMFFAATCAPRVSKSVDITCTKDGYQVDCSSRMLEGTKIRMRCKQYHDLATFSNSVSDEDTCTDGTWSQPILPCVPGQKSITINYNIYIIGTSVYELNGESLKNESFNKC